METKKSIITSYSAPSREHLWLNFSDSTLRYFNGQEWVVAGDKESSQGVSKSEFDTLKVFVDELEQRVAKLESYHTKVAQVRRVFDGEIITSLELVPDDQEAVEVVFTTSYVSSLEDLSVQDSTIQLSERPDIPNRYMIHTKSDFDHPVKIYFRDEEILEVVPIIQVLSVS